MRLINADELKRLVDKEWFDCKEKCSFFDEIDRTNTIDAIKHGKWIKISNRNYKCSCCNAWWSVDRDSTMKDYKYCPNCGASLEIYEDET